MERKWLVAIPILLALLAVCVAIGAIVFITARRIGPPSGLWFGSFGTYDVPLEAEEDATFTVGTPAGLVVESACGKVEVRAVEGTEMRVNVHKRAWGRNEAEAQEQLDTIRLEATQDGDSVRLGLENAREVCGARGRRIPEITFTVETPVETAVQVTTTFGSVGLDGTQGPAELSSRFGEINVANLEGSLNADTDNGAVTAQAVQAGDASIVLQSSFGRIRLEDAEAATLEVRATNGLIDVRQAVISDTVTLSSDFGGVTWDSGEGGSLEATSKNGQVSLTGLEIAGGLQAGSDFGAVLLEGVRAASYTANSKNGNVTINGATANVIAHSDFGKVDVTVDGEVTVDLSTNSGAITYTGGLGEGENVMRTRFGNILVRLPQDTGFTFDLETSFGKITSDFPITIQGEPDETHWQGEVGGGGPALTAATDNGNINLEYR